MLTLVTVIYGENRRYRVELFGSVLSILKMRQSDDTRIIVYTDVPLTDFPLPVTERIISAEEWQTWTRGSHISHLVKLHLIRQTLEESAGPVIYFDTDTLFLAPPEQLGTFRDPDASLMHASEGPISKHEIWANIASWLGDGRELGGVNLSSESVMYNSGIVGVLPEHREALFRSVAIADSLHEVDPVFSLDQFSTGSALGKNSRVETCEKEVLHYWGWGRAFIRAAIDDFWRQNEGKSLEEMCAAFDPASFTSIPPIHWLDKLYARYLELRWHLDGNGRFACLALKSALRHAGSDPDTANRWLAVHLDFLNRQQISPQLAARVRDSLAADYAACTPWANEANSAKLDALRNKPSAQVA